VKKLSAEFSFPDRKLTSTLTERDESRPLSRFFSAEMGLMGSWLTHTHTAVIATSTSFLGLDVKSHNGIAVAARESSVDGRKRNRLCKELSSRTASPLPKQRFEKRAERFFMRLQFTRDIKRVRQQYHSCVAEYRTHLFISTHQSGPEYRQWTGSSTIQRRWRQICCGGDDEFMRI